MNPGALVGNFRSADLGGGSNLVETPGLDVVDESTDARLVGDERTGFDARDRLLHVRLEAAECLKGKLRADPGLLLDLAFDLVVLEREHAAVGMVDQDNFLCAEQALR